MVTSTKVLLTLTGLDLSDLISMMARVSAQVYILLSKFVLSIFQLIANPISLGSFLFEGKGWGLRNLRIITRLYCSSSSLGSAGGGGEQGLYPIKL